MDKTVQVDGRDKDSTMSRRRVLGSAAAVAAVTLVPRHVLGGARHVAPSEKLNIAGIGIGGRGQGDLDECRSENVVALCDVDDAYAAKVYKKYPEALEQFRIAHRMTPEVSSITESMALCNIHMKNNPAALALADWLFARDTDSPGGHLIKMVIAINTGDLETARLHYREYKIHGQSRPDYTNITEYYKYLEK